MMQRNCKHKCAKGGLQVRCHAQKGMQQLINAIKAGPPDRSETRLICLPVAIFKGPNLNGCRNPMHQPALRLRMGFDRAI